MCSINLLIHSHYKYPSLIVDIHKHINDVTNLVNTIRYKKSEIEKLEREISSLEKELFISMQ